MAKETFKDEPVPAITSLDTKALVRAVESIAQSLQTLAQGPTRAGKPAGDGLLKILASIDVSLQKLAAK
jgi:hypothetical protein